MLSTTLEEVFRSLADTLPEQEEVPFTLNAVTLPQTPAIVTTDQLIIRAGQHAYHSYTHSCVDALHFHASKRTYRLLGLCLLAKVFHAEPVSIHIMLTHPQSTVRAMLLDYDQIQGWNLIAQYDTRPHQFTYEAHPVARPWQVLDAAFFPSWLLPIFTLTDAAYVAGPCDNQATRDVVRCVGSDCGSILVANMLLNLGRSVEAATEFVLEGEYGFGGVGRGSAEATFWLPGGDGYIENF